MVEIIRNTIKIDINIDIISRTELMNIQYREIYFHPENPMVV